MLPVSCLDLVLLSDFVTILFSVGDFLLMVLSGFAVLRALSVVGGLSSFFLFVTSVSVSIDVFCAEVLGLAVIFTCCALLLVFAGVLLVVSFRSVVAACLFVTASFCCRSLSEVLTGIVSCAAVLTFEVASCY